MINLLNFHNLSGSPNRIMKSSVLCITSVLLIIMSLTTSGQETSNFGECQTPDGNRGTCILLENCTSLYDMITRRSITNEDREFLRNSQCGTYQRKILVCCKNNNLPEERPNKIYTRTLAEITARKDGILASGDCTTPNAQRGNCVPLDNCQSLYSLLRKNPLLEEDKLFLRRSQCSSDTGKISVCCPDEKASMRSFPKALLPEPGVCGNVLEERIYGGTITKLDEFPWFAQILNVTALRVRPYCGGTLINDRYVLSAAHCFHGSENWTISIRLGEWDTRTDPDCVYDTRGHETCADRHIDIPVERIIIPPDYDGNSRSQYNDIALVRMSRSVEYTHYIEPICLPVRENLIDNSFEGIAMDVAGFGRTENASRSTVKLKAVVYGVSSSECRRMYGSRRTNIHLIDSQICAGGQVGVDTCKGDSGAALVGLDDSNKTRVYYYAAGIVSFGPVQCAKGGWAGIYTRVSSYIDWIKENIEP